MPTTFEAGTSLAHYRVISPLGAGGMGEVYKAQDLRLDRAVALKILPPELVRNDERVRRFMQEAKSASSLNHPNIVTIHEIGEAAVDGEPPIHYIAMELIDGATLRRRIHDDTDLRTLLVYLAQAAEGLAKAHAAGIVHRDLKPENIMVTRDGFAKVLDFGLAKLSVKKSADTTTERTVVKIDTREGALLGTVGYMSPEQVQGKPVDHRSDIFSFGCILYEAATRQRPFVADSDVDVMHKILHDKPQPIDEISPTVPAELRRLIRRCMAKDPEKRYHSMKDLALEITDIVDEFEELSASVTSASGSVSGEALAAIPIQRRMMRMTLGAAGIIVALALASSVYLWQKSHQKNSALVGGSMQIERVTSSGNVNEAAISPDGKYVAYVLSQGPTSSLLVRQTATGADVPVVPAGSRHIEYLTYSPDGNYLYYVQSEGQDFGPGYWSLFQVAALGGPPRKIAFDVDTAPGFSPDGKRIAWARGMPQIGKNSIVVANLDGTQQRELMRTDRLGVAPVRPLWTPDGAKVITTTRVISGGLHTDLIEVDVASGKTRTISSSMRRISDATMMPGGSGILLVGFQTDAWTPQIWLQPYPEGAPVRVTSDVGGYNHVSISGDGTKIAAITQTGRGDLVTVDPADTAGVTTPVTNGTADQLPYGIATAPGTSAIVYVTDHGNGPDIAILDGPGAAPRVLTNDHASLGASIAADKTIAFFSRREGGVPNVYVMDADGGNVRKLVRGGGPAISPDGRTVFYGTADSGLWSIPATGGTPAKISEHYNGSAAIDHRSSRLAFTFWKPQGARFEPILKIVPLGGGAALELPVALPNPIRWTPNDDGIAYIRKADGADNIFVQPLDGTAPKQLTHFRRGAIESFDWTGDGKLVLAYGEVRRDAVLIKNFH